MSTGPDHFRYRTALDEDGVQIICERLVVIGETPNFYYVVPWNLSGLAQVASAERLKSIRKRVSKTSGRRYCYPDKADALHSFRKRQQWRLSHAKTAISQATLALAQLDKVAEGDCIPDLQECGHDEHTASFHWK